MKTILLSIFLLLSGSVWGMRIDTTYTPVNKSGWTEMEMSVDTLVEYSDIKALIRAEIERWCQPIDTGYVLCTLWLDAKGDSLLWNKHVLPEPLKMVIDTVRRPFCDTTWIMCAVFNCDCGGTPLINCYGDYVIDTLYLLTPEQVERLR